MRIADNGGSGALVRRRSVRAHADASVMLIVLGTSETSSDIRAILEHGHHFIKEQGLLSVAEDPDPGERNGNSYALKRVITR